MLTGDLIRLHDVPPVACLGDLGAVAADPEAAARLVTGYLAGEAGNAYTLGALAGCLAEGQGGAFLVSGLYGAGKTHLLATIGLLAGDPALWPAFREAHPDLRRLKAPHEPALVAALPLDELGPEAPLETLVFAALERQLSARLGEPTSLVRAEVLLEAFERYVLPQHADDFAAWSQDRPDEPPAARAVAWLHERHLPLQVAWDRTEALRRLEELRSAHKLGMVVVLLDELGLHLAGCSRARREEDAGFLQFLAQVGRTMPILVVGAVQRALEDLGEMESHSLRQIRDRFRLCHLTSEHLRTVLATRLVERLDAEAVYATLEQWYGRWQADRRPYFTADDLRAAYPVNPLALELLESLAARSLSQTRSLPQLIYAAAHDPAAPLLARPCPALLTPPDLFTAFGPEVLDLPECQPQRRLYQLYLDNAGRVGFADAELGRALLQTLVLCSAAGLRWSVAELADSLLGCAAAGDRAQVLAELETMERFAGVRLERRGEEVRAGLDTETDQAELLRRRMNDLIDSFQPGDSRVWQAALAACAAPALPLAGLAAGGTVPVEWHNTRRPVSVSVVGPIRGVSDPLLPSPTLANLQGSLASPHSLEWAALHLCLPGDLAAAEAAWQASLPPADRFSPVVLCWAARPLREREWATLCEQAAVSLLLAGPMPRGGRAGEELRRLLAEKQAWLAEQVTEILHAAWWEGAAWDAAGRQVAGPAELAAAADLPAAVTLLCEAGWSAAYPQAGAAAPALRWQGLARNRALLAGLILPGACTDGPVADQARAVMAPLGLVESGAGVVGLAPAGPVTDLVLSSLPPAPAGEPEPTDCLPLGHIYGLLARSPYGLVPEQAELVAASLIRTGAVTALDAFMQPVGLQSDQPVSDYVKFLLAAPPADRAIVDLAAQVAAAAFGRPPSGARPHQVWDTILQWRQAVLRRADSLPKDLATAVAALGQDLLPWSTWQETLAAAAHLAAGLPAESALWPGLRALADRLGADPAPTLALLERYRLLRAFVDRHGAQAAALVAFAGDQGLALPKGSVLISARRRLLGLLSEPDTLVTQVERWTAAGDSFLAAYAREYVAWHAQAYGASRYRPLLALRQSPEWAALRALEGLPIPVADSYSRLDGRLAAALATHCPGQPLDLPGGGPVCPRCSLAMGNLPDLPAPGDLQEAAAKAIAAVLAALAEPPRRERLERAQQVAPPPPALRRRLAKALALAAGATPQTVADTFTPEVVEYVAAALRRRPAARRRAADLTTALAGREMTKSDAQRLFAGWLDPEGTLQEGDYLAVD